MMAISYAKELAMDFSREVRNLIRLEDYLEVFPFVGLRPDSKASFRWHTTGGGMYTAGGIKSGIAGKGAHIAIIDDPLSEQDAVSAASREAVKNWYPAGLRSRLAPGGRIIVVSTRWHNDDLCGWLLSQQESDKRSDKWEVLDIPALIETEKQKKTFGYEIGTSYWPERWPTEELLNTQANMPSHQWNALYQQRPTSQQGGIFKSKWFQEWPLKEPPKCDYILQSYDTAFSTSESADFSAITTWGVFHLLEEVEDASGKKDEARVPHFILLHSIKGRFEFHELRELGQTLYSEFKPDSLIIEEKASGQSLIQEFRRAGLPIIPYRPDRDKVARAYAIQPVLENMRLWVPRNKKWATELVDEAISFPYGAHDDIVDTMVQAVLWVRDNWKVSTSTDWFFNWKPPLPAKRRTYWSAVEDVATPMIMR